MTSYGPFTFRGVSRPGGVARPVWTVDAWTPISGWDLWSWLSHYTGSFHMKWIDEFITTFKCERPNHLLGPFWKLEVKGNLFVCPQIWTVASLTYKQQKRVCEFLFPIFFCPRAIFLRSLNILFNPICKMFYNFSLKLNMAKHRHFFLTLWVMKPRK